jgi:hypothetical protein
LAALKGSEGSLIDKFLEQVILLFGEQKATLFFGTEFDKFVGVLWSEFDMEH